MSVRIGAYFGKFNWLSEAFVVFTIIIFLFIINKKTIHQNFREKTRNITSICNIRQFGIILSRLHLSRSSLRVNLAILLLYANFMAIGINTVDAINMDQNEVTVMGSEDIALVEDDKVAVVIIPQDAGELFAVTLSNQSISILEELDYQIVRVKERADICRIRARQVLVLYTGHGVTDPANMLFVISGEQIHLSEIVENIEAEQLIMLTNACYGGSWLEFQAEKRLIISVVNDTVGHILGIAWQSKKGIRWEFKGSILELIAESKNSPVEVVYEKWKIEVIQFYKTNGFTGMHPVIYDGINGNVWL